MSFLYNYEFFVGVIILKFYVLHNHVNYILQWYFFGVFHGIYPSTVNEAAEK